MREVRAPSYCLTESFNDKQDIQEGESDSVSSEEPIQKLPLQAFNHLSREVLDEEKSCRFYKDILGFREINRPEFEASGAWLYGYGLNLHLIRTNYPEKRMMLKGRRLEHFETALPTVDHIAFTSTNLPQIESILKETNTFYKKFESDDVGVNQIFIFDPDGNVIEVSNCGVPIGGTKCSWKQIEDLELERDEQQMPTLRSSRSCYDMRSL